MKRILMLPLVRAPGMVPPGTRRLERAAPRLIRGRSRPGGGGGGGKDARVQV